MSILDVLLGRPISLDEAEEALGRPEKEEATDLSLHVSRCAKRWALSYRASRSNSAQLSQIRFFLILVGLLMVLNWPPAQKLIATFF